MHLLKVLYGFWEKTRQALLGVLHLWFLYSYIFNESLCKNIKKQGKNVEKW